MSSSAATEPPSNPFSPLLSESTTAADLRSAYSTHRDTRLAAQIPLVLKDGVKQDSILAGLVDGTGVDERYGISVVAKVSPQVVEVIGRIAKGLAETASGAIWTPPPSQLHLTLLEVIHSQPSYAALEPLLTQITTTNFLPTLSTIISASPAKLDSPKLGIDAGGLALTFLPSFDTTLQTSTKDDYTHHHLRRDIHATALDSSITPSARYAVPSAHVTVARFLRPLEEKEVAELVGFVRGVNSRLEREELEWRVGEEGWECKAGLVWYGEGDVVAGA
ncbi:hypothetical protein MNV49_004820 [Pseudohyphozyma bogoriensis]|nr:hypothetical protein MNV49_004820 [Pseudohyphozyma bogoriensis]